MKRVAVGRKQKGEGSREQGAGSRENNVSTLGGGRNIGVETSLGVVFGWFLEGGNRVLKHSEQAAGNVGRVLAAARYLNSKGEKLLRETSQLQIIALEQSHFVRLFVDE